MSNDELMRILPLLAPLVLIQVGLLVVALVDLARRQATRGPKWLWLIVILFIQLIGPLAYFLFGRSDE
jgi:hypothetical protein